MGFNVDKEGKITIMSDGAPAFAATAEEKGYDHVQGPPTE